MMKIYIQGTMYESVDERQSSPETAWLRIRDSMKYGDHKWITWLEEQEIPFELRIETSRVGSEKGSFRQRNWWGEDYYAVIPSEYDVLFKLTWAGEFHSSHMEEGED